MNPSEKTIPDHTAVRVALWRALHVRVDPPPHVLEDEIGLRLVGADSDEAWRERMDMNPEWTRGYRSAIVARARAVEDLVLDELRRGTDQYVVLGAGLDTFAQRRPEVASKLRIFEIDQPETQAWKRGRLDEIGLGVPPHLSLVPVDFEAGDSWREKLSASGFDARRPAVIASTGVSMYLTREANASTLREIAGLAPGSVLAMTFMLPTELVDVDERAQYAMVQERAAAAGTPFRSLFRPPEFLALARAAGFRDVEHLSRDALVERYFRDRADGLRPATGEEFLIART